MTLTDEDIEPHKHLFNSQDWKEFNKKDKDGNPEHNRFLVDPTAKVFRYLLKERLLNNLKDPYHD